MAAAKALLEAEILNSPVPSGIEQALSAIGKSSGNQKSSNAATSAWLSHLLNTKQRDRRDFAAFHRKWHTADCGPFKTKDPHKPAGDPPGKTPPPVVPAPSAILLGSIGLLLVRGLRIRQVIV